MQKVILSFLSCFSFAVLADEANTEQLDFSYSNWDVSGYIKVLADIPTDGRDPKVELDDLSIYLSGNINQWFNPFVEAEYFSGTIWQEKGDDSFTDGEFIFERLYNDFKVSEKTRLRVGKFLAPVGYWNLIHAAPLVWTINRPATSTYGYSNYVTGIEYGYILDDFIGSRFDIYLQLGDEFDPKPLSNHPRRYDKLIGGSWTLSDNLNSRSSIDFQYAEVKDTNTTRTTFSLQKIWYFHQWDIDAQVIYTKIDVGETRKLTTINSTSKMRIEASDGWDGGGYIQTRYRIDPKFNLYARGEFFHYAMERDKGNDFILGGRYLLGKWGNINVEYKWGSGTQSISNDGISISYNAMLRW